jgi:hypothetical protein
MEISQSYYALGMWWKEPFIKMYLYRAAENIDIQVV